MRSFHFMLLSMFLLGAACAPAADDGAGSSDDALAVAKVDYACGFPVVSSDGRYALTKTCLGGQQSVVRMNVADGTQSRLVMVDRDTIRAYGVAKNVAWYLTVHANESWDLTVQDLELARPAQKLVPVFPTGTPATATSAPYPSADDVLVTANGRHLSMVLGAGRFVWVANIAAATAPALIDVGVGRHVLLPAPDGSHLLVADGYRGLSGGDWLSGAIRKLDLAGAAPTLGTPVVSAAGPLFGVPGSYDGTTLFANQPNGIPGRAIGSLDVATGAFTALATGFGAFYPIEARGGHLWYSAARAGGYAIERVTRGGAGSALTLATTDRIAVGHLSTDGSTVLFTTGRIGERMELSTVVADGTAPATRVWNGGGDLMSESAGGGKIVFLERGPTGTFTWLVDDVTGAVVHAWPGDLDDPALSADGSGVYASRRCKVGAIDGHEVVRLDARETIVVPCSFASSQRARLLPIPGTGAVLSISAQAGSSDTSAMQVVLLRP